MARRPTGLVRTFHNARAVRLTGLSPWLYRRTDALIAVSREIEERGRRAGISPERLVRVDGVVDIGRFEDGDGAAIRKEFDLGSAAVIGCVARLAPRRGHELLIRAFQQLLPEYPHARLLLVGKGEARARLEALVSDLDLALEVLFAGYRDADLPAVLQALDAFARWARARRVRRAAPEAAAAGRRWPRVGALPEIQKVHGVPACWSTTTPESVTAALASRGAVEQAAAMGRAGRERARALRLRTPTRPRSPGVMAHRGVARAGR